MGVSAEIKATAGDIELYKNWRVRLRTMKPIAYDYVNGEARRYYSDGRGGYYYRRVSESEMHRGK